MTTRPRVGCCSPVITLNVVVLPAPFGPIMPVISPARAAKPTSLTASIPPNLTESALTSRTGSSSLSSRTDKAVTTFGEEDGRRRAGVGCAGRNLPARPGTAREVRDAAADPVRVASDADGGQPGQEILQLPEPREMWREHVECGQRRRAEQGAGRGVDAADPRQQQTVRLTSEAKSAELTAPGLPPYSTPASPASPPRL